MFRVKLNENESIKEATQRHLTKKGYKYYYWDKKDIELYYKDEVSYATLDLQYNKNNNCVSFNLVKY